MGDRTLSRMHYEEARVTHGITSSVDVTKKAEAQARQSGRLSEIVDPAVNPIRRSMIRLNPHQRRWIVTVGCPLDIEVNCDTTGSMGSEVDTEMAVLPDLYESVAKVAPGYDLQLCMGIFGDVSDKFVLCRPQFEMEADKIVKYLKEMAPQRDGGDWAEDPQYAMFARAYLTDAYTNNIGLKGYHFIVTDAACHKKLDRKEIKRIFGEKIFENELRNMSTNIPTLREMVEVLKTKTHQFILVVGDDGDSVSFWQDLCGEKSVVRINSTRQLPAVISAIIGLTEGTLDIGSLNEYLGEGEKISLIHYLSRIDIGAQAKLRHQLPHPIPQKGDIFAAKGDLWPVQGEIKPESVEPNKGDQITYV